MKKAILNPFYGEQELPELETLEQVEKSGSYAIHGYERPVHVEPVTPFGMSELKRQYPSMIFFTGRDGRTYYGMQSGRFV